jgi:DNA invertase Pin-like site-specific DNA recombinase
MGKPPRRVSVARYLRVSRTDQKTDLQGDETQEFVARRGWTLVDTFTDEGISGSGDRRPGLDALMKVARRRKFDILVVWRSDRLFRSLKHMVNILEELTALGIDFVSVTEPFDTTTPQGRLLLHLVSAFSEFERQVLIDRVRSGLAAARRRGRVGGRPKSKLDLDRAIELRAAGRTIPEVAKELGVSVATVKRRLATAAKGGSKTPVQDGSDDA